MYSILNSTWIRNHFEKWIVNFRKMFHFIRCRCLQLDDNAHLRKWSREREGRGSCSNLLSAIHSGSSPIDRRNRRVEELFFLEAGNIYYQRVYRALLTESLLFSTRLHDQSDEHIRRIHGQFTLQESCCAILYHGSFLHCLDDKWRGALRVVGRWPFHSWPRDTSAKQTCT